MLLFPSAGAGGSFLGRLGRIAGIIPQNCCKEYEIFDWRHGWVPPQETGLQYSQGASIWAGLDEAIEISRTRKYC